MVFVFQVDLTPLPWKSQTYVQNPLFRCLTVTYWVIVWTSFPHPNLMLEACLVWILVFISCEGSYGQSPTVVSASAFSVNAVSQRFVEGVWDCVRIPACMAVDTCWEWCVVVGLALFSKNETLLRFLLLFFCSLCLFFFFFHMVGNDREQIKTWKKHPTFFLFLCFWCHYVRVHEDGINSWIILCFSCCVYGWRFREPGPVMRSFIMSVSSDRKPEG